MNLPGADQINAVGQIPVLVLAMIIVGMTIILLIPVVRGIFTRQNSQDKNLAMIVELLNSKDKQIINMDANYDTLAEARTSQAASAQMQAESYKILGAALQDAIGKLPAAVATATIEIFLNPFKEYTKAQADMMTAVVLAQTEIITRYMAADSEKTLGMLGEIRDEVNKRLDVIERLTTLTEASVGRAEDRATGAAVAPLTAADIGVAVATSHAPGLTAADIGREVAGAIANNTPPAPNTPPNTGGGDSGIVKATLSVPDQEIDVNIKPNS